MDSKRNCGPKGQEGTDERQTDGGSDRRENVNFEALAREYAGLQNDSFWREEIEDRIREILSKLRDGEQVDYDELHMFRLRLQEFDQGLSEFLYRAGDLTAEQAREHGVRVEPEHSEYMAKHRDPAGGDDGDE